MRRLLVTGRSGQLGAELARRAWPDSYEVVATSRDELDISDPLAVRDVVEAFRPDVIVNCAAYTAVDQAEDEPDIAFAINDTAVGLLAHEADAVGAGLIHLSTDYVFDGSSPGWYTESDDPNPQNVYGASKRAGELKALEARRAVVVRTSWVFGALAPNFVLTMRRLGSSQDEVAVVADQVGCPTAAQHIAEAVAVIVERNMPDTGLFHVASPDDATWHDLAVAAIDSLPGANGVTVRAIPTSEYPTKAIRPMNSRLRSDAFAAQYGHRVPSWRVALETVSAELEQRERQ